MNYWALGHVHTRTILSENPWVVYPGNSQGRSIREQDARGCYLVQVDAQGNAEPKFLPLDVVRWHQTSVSINDIDSLDALDRRLVEEAEALPENGRDVVCRICIEGRGPLYKELRSEGAEGELLQRIRQNLESSDPLIWVQRIELNCLPQVDLQQRSEQGDLLAEVLTLANECAGSTEGLHQIKADALDDLWQNPRAKKGLAQLDDDRIRKILDEAKLLCLDLLEEEE
jgi:DNA repair exonuclease SbcCD nuclease subunit